MSNYIDKIKKDGVIYNIRSIGAYLVEQEPVVAPSGISGNLDYEPDEELGYQVLDTIYSAGQINTITYNGKVCYLLTANDVIAGNTAYYLSEFEPTIITEPEDTGAGPELPGRPGGGILLESAGSPKGLAKSAGDTHEVAQAILIGLFGGRVIAHQLITAIPEENNIWLDLNEEATGGDILATKYNHFRNQLGVNIQGYIDRKWDAWEEENGVSNNGGGEEAGPLKGETRGLNPRDVEPDENFEPTILDKLTLFIFQNYNCVSALDLLGDYTYDNNQNACIILTGLMPIYSDNGGEIDGPVERE